MEFKPRILIVDDEKRIRDACKRVLCEEGFNVELAANGDAGLDLIKSVPFDIVLLDLMMPGLSGLDVLKDIKLHHPGTVVIVITGYSTLEHSVDAMKNGAFDFIPKPFAPEDLRMVVNKALEQIRTLNDIATEKSRIRVLINQLGDGVLATDAQKKIVLANPSFLSMTGQTGEEIVGLPISDVVNNDRLVSIVERALAQSVNELFEVTDELEGEGELGDKIFGVSCIPFRDRACRNLGTITVLRDITMAKKMEQHKTAFVSMVSHEIRSPIHSVLAQIKVLLDGLAGELTSKQKEILLRSSEKLKALASMSTELLELARVESGLISPEKETIDLYQVILDQIEFHRPKALEKNIQIFFENTPKNLRLFANHQNIEVVLNNLISNAIHYTPQGGRVSVGGHLEHGFVVIDVTDTGFGISPEDQNRIFDRFFRAKNEKTRYIVGTGLGLAIVKSIIDAHHGKITISSQLEHGSTFSVYFPTNESHPLQAC